MNNVAMIVFSSWLAGFAAFVGGVVSCIEGSAETTAKREFIHGIVAFGGGILLSAVAFALAPVGMEHLGLVSLTVLFSLGGVSFCALDAWMGVHGGSRAQFLAMLMDFLPEALSLGAVFAHDHNLGMLLALFIGAQNLPEGFNSYREILKTGTTSRRVLSVLFAISFLGPLAAYGGYRYLQNRITITAGIMSFAAGGILYLVFQDIAPKATMRRHWMPPLGAVLGFIVGMAGDKLLG